MRIHSLHQNSDVNFWMIHFGPLKGHFHGIWRLYENREGVFASKKNFKTNDLVLLLKDI